MSSARAASFVLAVAASLILATAARADTPGPKAPPDLSLLLLPYAPGAEELSLVSPSTETEDGDRRRLARPFTSLGMGACALWATRAEWPSAGPQPLRPEAEAGFALAGVAVITVLAGTALARREMPVDGVHAVVAFGPGGGGVGLAARF
jgi:hypothetical protein